MRAAVAKPFPFGLSLAAWSRRFGRVAEWFKAAVLKTPCRRAVWYYAVRSSAIFQAKSALKLGRRALPYCPVLRSLVAKPVATDTCSPPPLRCLRTRFLELRFHGWWPFALSIGFHRFYFHVSRATCKVPGFPRWKIVCHGHRQS